MSPAGHTASSADREVATLYVQVPEKAVVYVGKFRSKGTGKTRRYLLEHRRPGQIVTLQVRVELMLKGHKIQETKQVELRAGAVSSLAFDFKDIATSLTLRVPPDAKVYLASSEKTGTGSVRVFTTNKLAAGQKISDFPVRVSIVRNGQLITKEQRILLTSGDSNTLSFRFDEDGAIAAVR